MAISRMGGFSLFALAVGFMAATGCNMPGGGGGGNTNDNDNTNDNTGGNTNDNAGNDNDGGGGGLGSFNLTGIAVHRQGRFAVGDNIIVYTDVNPDRTPSVPNYFVPGDTEGRGIPNAELYDSDSFEASGNKIILAGDNTGELAFGISIYDTDTDTMTDIPTTDIRLAGIPIGNYAPGFVGVDGNLVVSRNDAGSVDDGSIIKVIDISGADPVVIGFPNPEGLSNGLSVQQVAVDDDSRLAVAVSFDVLYVFNVDDPEGAVTTWDLSENGVKDTQIAFDNGIVLFADDSSEQTVHYLDVTDAANTPVAITTENRGAEFLTLSGDAYGFLYQGPASQGATAAIGTMPGTAPNISDGATVFESSANGGRFGYGETLAYGGSWYLGGIDDVSISSPFQSSAGGADWSVSPDPRSPDDNFAASDVKTNAGGTLLVFKYDVDDDEFVGFVDLGS